MEVDGETSVIKVPTTYYDFSVCFFKALEEGAEKFGVSVEELLEEIRKALTLGSARQLRRFASKAGFFAISWFQDSDMDANSKVAFDLGQFMQGRRIYASQTVHPISGPYEAYLRTWGWTGRLDVWYLYFRKINFPADPAVHGRWEWAGIYFGERMQ